ncbi:MAG: SurA N-terminal domain-containing protein [Spirochaetota bacterium]
MRNKNRQNHFLTVAVVVLVLGGLAILGSCANTEEPLEATGLESSEEIVGDSAQTEQEAEESLTGTREADQPEANAQLASGEQEEPEAPEEPESPEGELEVPGGSEPESDDEGFEQAKPMLKEQLMQQKQNEVLMDHISDLSQAADVDTHLESYEDLESDEAVALVNGEEIAKSELQDLERQQASNYGLDPESEESAELMNNLRSSILEQLVNTKLIEMEAEEAGLEATEEQVDQQYNQFAQQYGGEEEMEKLLEEQGWSPADLRDEIASQLPVQLYVEQYLEENFDPDNVEISDEELRELYEMQQQQQQQQQQVQPAQ